MEWTSPRLIHLANGSLSSGGAVLMVTEGGHATTTFCNLVFDLMKTDCITSAGTVPS